MWIEESASNSNQKWNHDECRCKCNKVNEVLVKTIVCGFLVRVVVSVIRYVKLTNLYILKNFHAKNFVNYY